MRPMKALDSFPDGGSITVLRLPSVPVAGDDIAAARRTFGLALDPHAHFTPLLTQDLRGLRVQPLPERPIQAHRQAIT